MRAVSARERDGCGGIAPHSRTEAAAQDGRGVGCVKFA